jgi:hypothetical protein
MRVKGVKYLSGAVIGFAVGTRIGPDTVVAKGREMLGRVRDRIAAVRSAHGESGSRHSVGSQVDPGAGLDESALRTALISAGSAAGANGSNELSGKHAALGVASKVRL